MRSNGLKLAAALCGLLFVASAARSASAQNIPPGSYKQTCSGIKTEGTRLGANCKAKEQSTLEKLLPGGEPFAPGSTFI